MQYDITRDDGAILRFERRPASGPAEARILLIHALAMDRSNWSEVLPLLPAICDVLLLDVRGHGRSTNGSTPLTLANAVEDIAAVLRAVGWPSAILAGCSMGGCIAQAFAARRPELVDGLVLIDTTAFYGADAPAKWAERAAKAEREGFAALLPFQRSRWFTEDFIARRADIAERAFAVFVNNDIASYKAACAMLAGADLRGEIGGITAPTSVVVGEEDYATPPAMAREMQAAIPGATLSILPGARHFTPFEAPAGIAAAIAEVAARARADNMQDAEA